MKCSLPDDDVHTYVFGENLDNVCAYDIISQRISQRRELKIRIAKCFKK